MSDDNDRPSSERVHEALGVMPGSHEHRTILNAIPAICAHLTSSQFEVIVRVAERMRVGGKQVNLFYTLKRVMEEPLSMRTIEIADRMEIKLESPGTIRNVTNKIRSNTPDDIIEILLRGNIIRQETKQSHLSGLEDVVRNVIESVPSLTGQIFADHADGISKVAISQWLKNGIPKARREEVIGILRDLAVTYKFEFTNREEEIIAEVETQLEKERKSKEATTNIPSSNVEPVLENEPSTLAEVALNVIARVPGLSRKILASHIPEVVEHTVADKWLADGIPERDGQHAKVIAALRELAAIYNFEFTEKEKEIIDKAEAQKEPSTLAEVALNVIARVPELSKKILAKHIPGVTENTVLYAWLVRGIPSGELQRAKVIVALKEFAATYQFKFTEKEKEIIDAAEQACRRDEGWIITSTQMGAAISAASQSLRGAGQQRPQRDGRE